ncbi:MAG: PDZ domain-containing protein, partial [Planctomycetaceae bacterium]|nr:PDZ domain-containing protein [Planctomycetaceae bacterium]
ALVVDYIGQYNEHAAAKRAGFQLKDVIVAVDGRQDLMTEADLMHYGVTERKPGQNARVTVVREGRERTLQLPMQQ